MRVSRARLNGETADGDRLDPIGVRRRLQALYALGWTDQDVATLLGRSRMAVRQLRCRESQEYVFRHTHERICEVYDRLSMTVPQGPYATRCRRLAARLGYQPPLAWDDDTIDLPPAEVKRLAAVHKLQPMFDALFATGPAPSPAVDKPVEDADEVLIERIVNGTAAHIMHTASRAELNEALRRMTALGLSDTEIATRTASTANSVCIYRRRNGIPAGIPPTRKAA
jgi:hypothetical protein